MVASLEMEMAQAQVRLEFVGYHTNFIRIKIEFLYFNGFLSEW